MREQLLNDEARRDDAHGAVELPPPPLSDHGAGAQVALAAPDPSSAADPRVVYGAKSGYTGTEGVGSANQLGPAMQVTKTLQSAYPAADFRLFGRTARPGDPQ